MRLYFGARTLLQSSRPHLIAQQKQGPAFDLAHGACRARTTPQNTQTHSKLQPCSRSLHHPSKHTASLITYREGEACLRRCCRRLVGLRVG